VGRSWEEGVVCGGGGCVGEKLDDVGGGRCVCKEKGRCVGGCLTISSNPISSNPISSNLLPIHLTKRSHVPFRLD